MKKQLLQIHNNKTVNRTMPVLFTLALMLVSVMGRGQTAYITNSESNNVSVINVATNTVINTIPVGEYPYAVSVSPDGSKVYVTNEYDNTISVINTATNTVSATINVGLAPQGIAVSPDGSKVYVSSENAVYMINAAADTVSAIIQAGDEPFGIAVSSDGSKVYVADFYTDSVSVISTATNSVYTTLAVGYGPSGIAASPDGIFIYVTNGEGNSVSVLADSAGFIVNNGNIPLVDNQPGIVVSPDGSTVYVTDYQDVIVITNGIQIVSDIGVGVSPIGISITPDGSKVYVANNFDNTVSVINTVTNTVSATIKVGNAPVAFGNFISTHISPTCNANFSIYPDTTLPHHYLVTDNSYGVQPLSYIWSWGDGSQDDTIPYPSHTYMDSGFYTICLSITDSTGCQSTFCDSGFDAMRTTNTMVYVNVVNPFVTGTEVINAQAAEVSIYPDPVADKLFINSSGLTGNYILTIFNIVGEVIYTETVNSKPETVNCTPFPAGMYFVEMKTENGSVVKRFVKE